MINISLQTFKTIIMKRLVSVLLLQTLCIAAMFAQVTFKPTSATINDNQGSYTSQHFDCGNMIVTDNKNSILISLAGNRMTLYSDEYNKDTYIHIARQGNTEVKAIAFRSSKSNHIYLITITTKEKERSIQISFAPNTNKTTYSNEKHHTTIKELQQSAPKRKNIYEELDNAIENDPTSKKILENQRKYEEAQRKFNTGKIENKYNPFK